MKSQCRVETKAILQFLQPPAEDYLAADRLCSGSELPIADLVTRITVGTRKRVSLGGCHVESKNGGERASGVRNHTCLCLGLFVRRNPGLSRAG